MSTSEELDIAENIIHAALSNYPRLDIRPLHVTDDKRSFEGRMVKRQEVRIEEIGDKL